jgi:hypothetical protein
MKLNNSIDDIPGIEKERKFLPYSITPIGGPDEHKHWLAKRKEEQEEFVRAEEARMQRVVQGMENGELLVKEYKKSYTTEVHETYRKRLKKVRDQYYTAQLTVPPAPKEIAEPSMLQKIYDYFLNLPF